VALVELVDSAFERVSAYSRKSSWRLVTATEVHSALRPVHHMPCQRM